MEYSAVTQPRPWPRSQAGGAAEVAARIVPPLLADPADAIRLAAAALAGTLKLPGTEPALLALAADAKASGAARAGA
ncbi:MAG: hypothetical protein N2444_02495, partial [Methylocystis sp.]|nr:hypothetical protein [Methylocystis sp.]